MIRNSYKNTVKGLRKGSGICEKWVKTSNKNRFTFLEVLDSEIENNIDIIERKKKYIQFDDLPQDVVNIILGFIPVDIFSILKHKYNKHMIRFQIEKMSTGMNKLWHCAKISNELLESLLENDSSVFEKYQKYSIKSFTREKNIELYSRYYKENFKEVILAAIHHYTKIYKFSYYTNKKVIEHIEKTILHIFAHLSMLN